MSEQNIPAAMAERAPAAMQDAQGVLLPEIYYDNPTPSEQRWIDLLGDIDWWQELTPEIIALFDRHRPADLTELAVELEEQDAVDKARHARDNSYHGIWCQSVALREEYLKHIAVTVPPTIDGLIIILRNSSDGDMRFGWDREDVIEFAVSTLEKIKAEGGGR